MASGSESDGDSFGSVSPSNNESNNYLSNSHQNSARYQNNSNSDYTAAAAAQMQYMQQQQQMMMNPGSYLPFMVPSAYQVMLQQQQQQQQQYSQNFMKRENEALTSPLNLQTSKQDRSPTSNDQSTNPCVSANSNISSSHTTPPLLSSSASQLLAPTSCRSIDPPKSDVPPPPKRPLTPYMRFSKCMWQEVKSSNPGMSVCEIGATIGRLWRELSSDEKQKHNNEFSLDKVRYDSELKQYLKNTGLRSRDLVKIRAKNKQAAKAASRRPAAGAASSQQQALRENHHQLGQSFVGLPMPGMAGSLPMGMSMGMMGFPQMWSGQQYPSQQQMLASMQLAHQQGFYSNGSAVAAATEGGAGSQLHPAASGDPHAASMYLYSQNFM